jgi:hypothetical protein
MHTEKNVEEDSIKDTTTEEASKENSMNAPTDSKKRKRLWHDTFDDEDDGVYINMEYGDEFKTLIPREHIKKKSKEASKEKYDDDRIDVKRRKIEGEYNNEPIEFEGELRDENMGTFKNLCKKVFQRFFFCPQKIFKVKCCQPNSNIFMKLTFLKLNYAHSYWYVNTNLVVT